MGWEHSSPLESRELSAPCSVTSPGTQIAHVADQVYITGIIRVIVRYVSPRSRSMSREAVEELMDRYMNDPVFRARMKADPQGSKEYFRKVG